MATRMGSRMFTSALRAAMRQQQRIVTRRGMSSSAHPAKSSDTTWQIVSAAVFIPAIGYLLSPAARETPKRAHAASGHGTPKVPAETAAPSSSHKPADDAVVADDEGTAVPASEGEDSPRDAAQTEAAEAAESSPPPASDSSAPGQTSESEGGHEQKDKPHDEPKKGTLQSEGDEAPQPTDLGTARSEAKKGSAPKEAASSD